MPKFIFAGLVAVVALSAPGVCLAQEPPVPLSEQEMSRLIKQLSSENERLRNKVTDLERRLQNHSIRDRMVLEEQRSENLEEQLFAIARDEANLQTQLEEVNEQMRPENIEQMQVMGSLRPEEVRESARRRLSNQQRRIQDQLQLLQERRNRIHSSIAVTDMLIQNLRMQMQTASRP